MDGNILEVGKLIRCMEVVNSIFLMEVRLKVFTKWTTLECDNV